MRRALLVIALVAVGLGLFWRAGESQPPLPRMRLQGAHTSIADVDHAGALYVTALTPLSVSGAVSQSGAWTIQAAHQGGQWNVAHVASVLHVAIVQGVGAGAQHLLVAPVYQAGAWNVAAAQSGTWTIQAAHLTGAPSVSQGSAWAVAAHAQQSGAWTIQAAHLAGIPSVSQGTVWATLAHAQQSGAWTIQAAHLAGVPSVSQGAMWAVAAHAQQSGAWTIQAAHQGGEWNIRHVGSVLHVSIIQGGPAGANHLLVAPVYQAGPWNVSAAQSGIFSVQAAHLAGVPSVSQGTAWAVVAHAQQSGAWTVQAAHLAGVPSVSQGAMWAVAAHAQQSGAWTVQAAHQGGEWNIRHVSSVTHIEAAGGGLVIRDPINPNARARVDHTGALTANPATYAGKTLTYVSVNQGVAGTTTLAAASVGNKHKVLGVILTMSLLGTLKFNDGVADLTGPMDIAATGGLVSPTSLVPYVETGATNRALDLVTTLGAARGVVVILTEP